MGREEEEQEGDVAEEEEDGETWLQLETLRDSPSEQRGEEKKSKESQQRDVGRNERT